MVEEVCSGDLVSCLGTTCIKGPDLGVNGRCLSRYGFQHGVAAQRIKVGTRVCEGEVLGNNRQ